MQSKFDCGEISFSGRLTVHVNLPGVLTQIFVSMTYCPIVGSILHSSLPEIKTLACCRKGFKAALNVAGVDLIDKSLLMLI